MTNRKEQTKGQTPTSSREESIIKYGIIALAVILGISLVIFVVVSLLPTYILMVGERRITEEEFNFYYLQERNFLLQHKNSVAPDMSDEDFMSAMFNETWTFRDLAKHRAISRIQEVFILNDWATGDESFRFDPQEIEDRKNTFRTQFEEYAFNMGQDLEDLSKQIYGVNLERVLEIQELSWIAQKYEEHLSAIMTPDISEDEILSYYNTYQHQFDQATVRHILIATIDPSTGQALSEENREIARTRAQSLYERVVAMEDMVELARTYSEDPGVAQNDGVYVFRSGDAYLEEFVSWAFQAQVNEVGLVQTAAGFHIMMLLDRTGFEEARQEVLDTILLGRIMEAVDAVKATEEYSVRYFDAFTRF